MGDNYPSRANLLFGFSVAIGAAGGVYILSQSIRYLCQLTERRQRRKRIEEPCNVCCIDLDGDNIKSTVKCVNCQKSACRGTSCSIWIPSQSGWECQLCNQSQESISKSSEWLHQQITGRYLSPFSARSEPSLLRNHHSPTPDVDRRSDVASSFYGEQKERVREMIEETLGEMLGGSLDNISVNQLYKSRQYLELFCKYHSLLSHKLHRLERSMLLSQSLKDLPTWENGEAPGMSHIKLKRFIEKIINDAIRLPNFTNEPSTPGPISDQDLPFFDPKKYQELLATAVLNKIVDSYNYEQKFDNNNKDAATDCSDLDTNHNALISRKVQSGSISSSSIEPESDCSITDPPSHASRLEHFSRSSSAANQFAEALGRYDHNSSSMLTDYLNKHSVPLPDFSIESDSSNEDNLSASKNMGPSWEGNWLFKKKRPGHESPAPIGMLVPCPKEDIKTQIGDKTADELSDLSEAGSECGDNNVDEIEDNAPNALIQNRNIIGGKSPIGIFDELLEQTSLISTSSIPEGDSAYTETKNDYVLGDDLNHDLIKSTKSFITEEAINSLVDTQTLQNNLSKSKENEKLAPVKANLQELPKPRPRSAQKAAVYLSTKEISESELTSSSTASLAIESEGAFRTLNNDPQSESTNTNTNNNFTQEEKPAEHNTTETMLKKIQCTKASAIQFLVVVSLAPSLAIPTPDSETLGAIAQAPDAESSQQDTGPKETGKGETSQNVKQGGIADTEFKTQNKNDSTAVGRQKGTFEQENSLRKAGCLDGMSEKSTNDSVQKMECEKDFKNFEEEALVSHDKIEETDFSYELPTPSKIGDSTALVDDIASKLQFSEKEPTSDIFPGQVDPNNKMKQGSESKCYETETKSDPSNNEHEINASPDLLVENFSNKDHEVLVLKETVLVKNAETFCESEDTVIIRKSLKLEETVDLVETANKVTNEETIKNSSNFAESYSNMILPPIVENITENSVHFSEYMCRVSGTITKLNEKDQLVLQTLLTDKSDDLQTPNRSENLELSLSNEAEAPTLRKPDQEYECLIDTDTINATLTEVEENFKLAADSLALEYGTSVIGTTNPTEAVIDPKVSEVPIKEKKGTAETDGELLGDTYSPGQVALNFEEEKMEDKIRQTSKTDQELDDVSRDQLTMQETKSLGTGSILHKDLILSCEKQISCNSSSYTVDNIDLPLETKNALNNNEYTSEESLRIMIIDTPDDNVKEETFNYVSEAASENNENISNADGTSKFADDNQSNSIRNIPKYNLDEATQTGKPTVSKINDETSTTKSILQQIDTKEPSNENEHPMSIALVDSPLNTKVNVPASIVFDNEPTLDEELPPELMGLSSPDSKEDLSSSSETSSSISVIESSQENVSIAEISETEVEALLDDEKPPESLDIIEILGTDMVDTVPLCAQSSVLPVNFVVETIATSEGDVFRETKSQNCPPITTNESSIVISVTSSGEDKVVEKCDQISSTVETDIAGVGTSASQVTTQKLDTAEYSTKKFENLKGNPNNFADKQESAVYANSSIDVETPKSDSETSKESTVIPISLNHTTPLHVTQVDQSAYVSPSEARMYQGFEEYSEDITADQDKDSYEQFKSDDEKQFSPPNFIFESFDRIDGTDKGSLDEFSSQTSIPQEPVVLQLEQLMIVDKEIAEEKLISPHHLSEINTIVSKNKTETNSTALREIGNKFSGPTRLESIENQSNFLTTFTKVDNECSNPEENIAEPITSKSCQDYLFILPNSEELCTTLTAICDESKANEVPAPSLETGLSHRNGITENKNVNFDQQIDRNTATVTSKDSCTAKDPARVQLIFSNSEPDESSLKSEQPTETECCPKPVNDPSNNDVHFTAASYMMRLSPINLGVNSKVKDLISVKEPVMGNSLPTETQVSSAKPIQITKLEGLSEQTCQPLNQKDTHFTETSYMIRLPPISPKVDSKEDLNNGKESVAEDLTKTNANQGSLSTEPKVPSAEPEEITRVEGLPVNQKEVHFTEASYMIRLSHPCPKVKSMAEDLNHTKTSAAIDLIQTNASQGSLPNEQEKTSVEPQNTTRLECLAEPECEPFKQEDAHYTDIAYAIRLSSSLEVNIPIEPEEISNETPKIITVGNRPETPCQLFDQNDLHFTEAPCTSLEVESPKDPENISVGPQQVSQGAGLTKQANIHQRDVHFTETPYAIRVSPSLDMNLFVGELAEADANIALSVTESETDSFLEPTDEQPYQNDPHFSERPYMIRLLPTFLEVNSAIEYTLAEGNDNYNALKLQCDDYIDETDSAVDSEVVLREMRNTEIKRSSAGLLETIFERQDAMDSSGNPSKSEKAVKSCVDTTFESCPINDSSLLVSDVTYYEQIEEVISNSSDVKAENCHGSVVKDDESNSFEEKLSLSSVVKLENMVKADENKQENHETRDDLQSLDSGSILNQTALEYEQKNNTLDTTATSVSQISEELTLSSITPVINSVLTDEEIETKPLATDCVYLLKLPLQKRTVSLNADQITKEPAEVSAESGNFSKLNVAGSLTTKQDKEHAEQSNTESQRCEEYTFTESNEKESTNFESATESWGANMISPQEKTRPSLRFKSNIQVITDSEIATLESILHGDTQSVVDSAQCYVEHIIDPPADFAMQSTVPECIIESTSPAEIDLNEYPGVINTQDADVDSDDNLNPETNVQKDNLEVPSCTHVDSANLNTSESTQDSMKKEYDTAEDEIQLVDEIFSFIKASEITNEHLTPKLEEVSYEAFTKPTDDTPVVYCTSTPEKILSPQGSVAAANNNSDNQINANESESCFGSEISMIGIQEQVLANDDICSVKYEANESENADFRIKESRKPEQSILEIRKLIQEVLNDAVLLNSECELSNQDKILVDQMGIPSVSLPESANVAVASDSFLKNPSQCIMAPTSSEVSVVNAEESTASIIDSEGKLCDVYIVENATSYSDEIQTGRQTDYKLAKETTPAQHASQKGPALLTKTCTAVLAANVSQEDHCKPNIVESVNMLEKTHAEEPDIPDITKQVRKELMNFQKPNINEYQTVTDNTAISMSAVPTSLDAKFHNNSEVEYELLSTVEGAAMLAVVGVSQVERTYAPEDLEIISVIKDSNNSVTKEDTSNAKKNPGEDEVCSGIGKIGQEIIETFTEAVETPLQWKINCVLTEPISIRETSNQIDPSTVNKSVSSDQTTKTSNEIKSADAQANIRKSPEEKGEEFVADTIETTANIFSKTSSERSKEITLNPQMSAEVDFEILSDVENVGKLTASNVFEAPKNEGFKTIAATVQLQEVMILENLDESLITTSASENAPKTCTIEETQISTVDSDVKDIIISAELLADSLSDSGSSEINVNTVVKPNSVSKRKPIIDGEINHPAIGVVNELNMEIEKGAEKILSAKYGHISNITTSVQPTLTHVFTNEKVQNMSTFSEKLLNSEVDDTNFELSDLLASGNPCSLNSAEANITETDDLKSLSNELITEVQIEAPESENVLTSTTAPTFNSDTEVFAITSHYSQSSTETPTNSPVNITKKKFSEIENNKPNFAGKIFEKTFPHAETGRKVSTNSSSSKAYVLSCNKNIEPKLNQTVDTELIKPDQLTASNEENKVEPNFEPNNASLDKYSSNSTAATPIEMSNKFLDACKASSDTDLESWINHLEQVIIELSNSPANTSSDSTIILEQLVDENSTEIVVESTEAIADSISATLMEPMNTNFKNFDSASKSTLGIGGSSFDEEFERTDTGHRNDVAEVPKSIQNIHQIGVFDSSENTEIVNLTSETQPTALFEPIAKTKITEVLPVTLNQGTEIVKSQVPNLDEPGYRPVIKREPTIVITYASSDSQSDNSESILDIDSKKSDSENINQFEGAKESSSSSVIKVDNLNKDSNGSSAEITISHETPDTTILYPDDLHKPANDDMRNIDDTSSSETVNAQADETPVKGENIEVTRQKYNNCDENPVSYTTNPDSEQQNENRIGRTNILKDQSNTVSKQTTNNSNILGENANNFQQDSFSENQQLAENIQEPENWDQEIDTYQSDFELQYESFTSMTFIRTPLGDSQFGDNFTLEPTDDSSEAFQSYDSFAAYNSIGQTEIPAMNSEHTEISGEIRTTQAPTSSETLTVETLEFKATSSSSEDVSAYDTAPSSFTEVLSRTPPASLISSSKTTEVDNIPANSSSNDIAYSTVASLAMNTAQVVDIENELTISTKRDEGKQSSENVTIASFSSVSFKTGTSEKNSVSALCCEQSKQNQTELNNISCADGKHCIIADAFNLSAFLRPSEGLIYQEPSSAAAIVTDQSQNILDKDLVELEHPIKIPIYQGKCREGIDRRGTIVSPSLELAEDALEALSFDANYDTDPLGSSRISTDIEETTFINPIYTSTDSLPWHAIKDDNEEVDGGLTSPESEPEFSITPPEISLCYMTPHVLDIIPEEFSESPPLDGIAATCLPLQQIGEYFIEGADTSSVQHVTEKPEESIKQSPYQKSTPNLKENQESDAALDTTQQEDKLSPLATAIAESSSAFILTNTELIQTNVEVSNLPTDKLTYNESSSTTTTTSNDTICTAVESLSRKIVTQLSTDDEVELHKDMETTITTSPISYLVSKSMQLTNEPTNTPHTHQSTQNPPSTEVNVQSTSSKSAPTSTSASPFHATRADSFGSASCATTKPQQIKFEILKHAAFSQPLPDEEDAAENGDISHFLPGSIAEREHKKWYNAVEMPNNPYSREALKRRLSATSDKPIDIPNINSPLDKATCEDKLGRTVPEDETIIEAPKVDYKRYGRDYYINDAKYASGTRKLKLSSSVSMHGLNVRDDKSFDKEPTLQSQQSLSSSLSSLHRSHSWGDKRSNSNLVPGGGGGSTCDIFTARPVRVEESDPILSRATKLDYLSTPDRDFYLLPSEEISSLRSISASEHSLSQAGDSLTPSEDSDTIRVYDLKKQETRLIRDDDSISAVTAVKGLIYTNNSSRVQPQQPGQTPNSPRAPLTAQRSFRTTVINRGSTPTAFKFLQPKRRLYDTRRIMSEDTSSIVRENTPRTNGTVEKSVIEEEVIPALPSVKALAKVFQGSTDSSNVQLSRPKSYSWKSVDVKTKEEPAPVENTTAPEPVPRTIPSSPPAVNGEEKLETEPAKESYSPSYEQTYIPAESPVIPPEVNGISAAIEDLRTPESKEPEVTVNSVTEVEPALEPVQIEEQSSQIAAPTEESVQTLQLENTIESSVKVETVSETPKEEVHIPKEPCADSYSPPYDQKYIPAESPASQESETIEKSSEEKVDQSNSLEWKEDNIEIILTPKDDQHATPPNTPETEEHKTPEETDKPIIESITLPTETIKASSMNPSHEPRIVEQFLENEKRSAMPPVNITPLTNASVSEAKKNDSISESVSESEAVQVSSGIPTSAAEITASDTTSTLEPAEVPTPAERKLIEEPKPALELTSEPIPTEEPIEPSAPVSPVERTPPVEVIPTFEAVSAAEPTETTEPSSLRDPSSTSSENSIAEKAPEATLNNDHPTIDTKPAQNGFSEPSLASPTQNVATEQSKQNNVENRLSEIRFTQESHTRDRPISPVLVPGKLKSSIAFFENLKNKK